MNEYSRYIENNLLLIYCMITYQKMEIAFSDIVG
jgi:hypothetical protein